MITSPNPNKNGISLISQPRLAIFQAHWHLHSSTVYAAATLAQHGYLVDVFLSNVNLRSPCKDLHRIQGVFVYVFEHERPQVPTSRLAAQWRRGVRFLQRQFGYLFCSPKEIVSEKVIHSTDAIMRNNRYRALIGVEKGGLAWAAAMAEIRPVPLIYSNLELYTRDIYWDMLTKRLEERAHRRCWATIVQDRARADILLADNGVTERAKLFYLPVSRLGPPQRIEKEWLQRSLALDADRIIILYYGFIAEKRYAREFAELAQCFDEKWILVFHGISEELTIRRIAEADTGGRVKFSLQLVDMSDEPMVVGSAHISLVLYKREPLNECLTGFSSEKLALSLQCGVPVIAFDYPTYGHIRDEGCGVLVKELSEIPCAVSRILSDYDSYRRRAFSSFERHYRFETNFKKVIDALDVLPP